VGAADSVAAMKFVPGSYYCCYATRIGSSPEKSVSLGVVGEWIRGHVQLGN